MADFGRARRRAVYATARGAAVAVLVGASAASGQDTAVKAFDAAVVVNSFKVDVAVAEVPGTIIKEQGDDDFSLAVGYSGGLAPTGEVGMIGKTATSDKSFAYFAAVGGFASADVWAELSVTSLPIPETVRYGDVDKPLEYIEVQIRGRVREADLDATVCGAAWTAQLTGVHVQSQGSPDADYDFPSVGCLLPEGKILDIVSDVQDAFEIISKIEQGLAVAQVGFGIWQDLVVRIPVDLRDLPRNQPVDMTVQLGRRVGSALAAGSVSGGEIQVYGIHVVGWIGVDTTVTLRTFHRYTDGSTAADKLIETFSYDIKRCLPPYKIEPCPEVTYACPPYPLLPTQRLHGRIYAIEGDRFWRLEYMERDRDPDTRLPVMGATCNYGPIEMDRSHRVVLGFQLGAADLFIAGLRADPATPRAGEQFNLYAAVRNAGDLSTLDADRWAPLDGWVKLRISAGGASADHVAVVVLQPGATQEFYVGSWPCDAPLVYATVDAGDDIVEGAAGEMNNSASLSLPQCHPVSPKPTSTGTPTATATATRTATGTRTSTRTRTNSATRTGTRTRTATASATPTRTGTASRTPTFTRTATATMSLSPTLTPASSATPTPAATASPTSRPPATLTAPPATATSTRTPSATVTPTRILLAGDANCDGAISAADFIALVLFMAGDHARQCAGSAGVEAIIGAIFGGVGSMELPG